MNRGDPAYGSLRFHLSLPILRRTGTTPSRSSHVHELDFGTKKEDGDGEDVDDDDDDDQEDYWPNASARAGDLRLCVGLAGLISDEDEWHRTMEPLGKMGDGLGGTLQAVGAVWGACLGKECLDAKTNLRAVLTLCTTVEDNHLRPLVFALCADQFFHMAPDHAAMMLRTPDEPAAGLGAQPKPPKPKGAAQLGQQGAEAQAPPADNVGNAHLRMWIGERALGLKRRKEKRKFKEMVR